MDLIKNSLIYMGFYLVPIVLSYGVIVLVNKNGKINADGKKFLVVSTFILSLIVVGVIYYKVGLLRYII